MPILTHIRQYRGVFISSISHIRKLVRQRRQRLGIAAQWRASYRLARSITRSPIYQQSRAVAVYLSMPDEISLNFLIKRAWKQGKVLYLPVVRKDGLLSFTRYSPMTCLKKSHLNILEPKVGQCLHSGLIDLVLMPLVAFDSSGHRIGMGGGFYDRTFGYLLENRSGNDTKRQQRPYLMGVAHRCQRVQSISLQKWDVPLSSVQTG